MSVESAETLLRAVAQLREDWQHEDVDDLDAAVFHLAVADWLESTANDVAHVQDPIYNLTSTTVARAIKVARTYLGES